MAYCPNVSDEQVVKDFNSIIEHFGGKPLSQEEFRDPVLRDSRIGVDRDAMRYAYYLWISMLETQDLLNSIPIILATKKI